MDMLRLALVLVKFEKICKICKRVLRFRVFIDKFCYKNVFSCK